LIDFALFASPLRQKDAKIQSLAGEFPLAANRESLRRNRELISRNREFTGNRNFSSGRSAFRHGSSVSAAKPADDHPIISRPNRGGEGCRRVSR
jgi:hypothetical protein